MALEVCSCRFRIMARQLVDGQDLLPKKTGTAKNRLSSNPIAQRLRFRLRRMAVASCRSSACNSAARIWKLHDSMSLVDVRCRAPCGGLRIKYPSLEPIGEPLASHVCRFCHAHFGTFATTRTLATSMHHTWESS